MTKRTVSAFVLVFGLMLLLTASNSDADFIQCVGFGTCNGTPQSDVINGTPDVNEIFGDDGDDTIFAGDNPVENQPCNSVSDEAVSGPFVFGVSRCAFTFATEFIYGGPGNDFISGGPGRDTIAGDAGNDVILANTDVIAFGIGFGQYVNGGAGNDTVFVLAGDVSACLVIQEESGFDSVNLIGFGPFSATPPFGQPGFGIGWVLVKDSIGGGDIFIRVVENGDGGVEVINGLLSPDVVIVGDDGPPPVNNCQFSSIM